MDSATYRRASSSTTRVLISTPRRSTASIISWPALKREGIYTNLNLHVGRRWGRVLNLENAAALPYQDKLVDLYHSKLIEAEKRFAADLLNHVNAYTKTRYADEPAVAMVEINNENTFFYWGGEQMLAKLGEPYAGELQKLWNDWLIEKYATRGKLATAWVRDGVKAGAAGGNAAAVNLLRDPAFATLGKEKPSWVVERHAPADMNVTATDGGARIEVKQVDGVEWHLQFHQPGLKFKAGTFYTLSFRASADRDTAVGVGATQAHAPWQNLGLGQPVQLTTEPREHRLGFTATASDDDARVSFAVGGAAATIRLSDVVLREGGREGLRADENPTAGTVRRSGHGSLDTAERTNDWYRFLQATDERYFVMMRQYLKDELGVKAPITGTIGIGPMGTMSQSQMDFVDAHAYWDHPTFPGGSWSSTNWRMHNKPMVDDPEHAAVWTLASTRVEGKPFTVTEYNHSHPNEWQAESVPLIAALAAQQDWDAVFLFAYSHTSQFERDVVNNFFDFEGNPLKMAHVPLAARLFHTSGGVQPSAGRNVVAIEMDEILPTASKYYYEQWGFLRDVKRIDPAAVMARRLSLRFDGGPGAASGEADARLRWASKGSATGTGQFTLNDPRGIVFAGFAAGDLPLDLGPLRIEKMETPFATLILVPADPAQTIQTADRLLLSIVARGGNTGMEWDAKRTTVSDRWGRPPVTIEPVRATLTLAGKPAEVVALTPEGKPGKAVATEHVDGKTRITIGSEPTAWYEIRRR